MKKRIWFGVGAIFVLVLIVGLGFVFMRRPMISVVMATYNRADTFLPRAIESILSQTYDDFEFIIINDGSTDGTADVLADYAARDDRIKIITNSPNQGLIASLNKGLAAARGKYIARMDDDDESYPNRFERQVAYLEAHPDITVAGAWVSPPGRSQPYSFQRETDPERVKIQLYLGIAPVCHPVLMMRRDFLRQHDIWYRDDYPAAEDRPFYGDILNAGGAIANIPEVLLYYRLHGSNNRQYYSNQTKNVRRFHAAFINRFFPFSIDDTFRKCDLLPRMIEANKVKGIVDQQKLSDMYFELCGLPAERQIQLSHPFWQDIVAVNNGRVRRSAQKGEFGHIVRETEDVLTIKWDNWGNETFVRNGDGVYVLQGE